MDCRVGAPRDTGVAGTPRPAMTSNNFPVPAARFSRADSFDPIPPMTEPGSALVLSGQGNKGSGTPAGAYFKPPHFRVRLALKRSALANRRSTAALAAANQRRRSASDALPGTRLKNGGYPSPPVPVQRQSRRPVIVPAGRCPEAARERSVSPRPREPHLAPPPRAPPRRRPFERDSRTSVPERETKVKILFSRNSVNGCGRRL